MREESSILGYASPKRPGQSGSFLGVVLVLWSFFALFCGGIFLIASMSELGIRGNGFAACGFCFLGLVIWAYAAFAIYWGLQVLGGKPGALKRARMLTLVAEMLCWSCMMFIIPLLRDAWRNYAYGSNAEAMWSVASAALWLLIPAAMSTTRWRLGKAGQSA